MTEQNPATYLQGGTHPAEGLRRMTTSLVGDTTGVVLSTDLAVTERGAGANMSVDVAAGRAFIEGDEGAFQGTYHVENRATVNLTVTASHATLDRIDLVVAKVEDSDYSGATDAWSLAIVDGTAAGSPSAPSAPANSITLASIYVTALDSSIVDAQITDLRTIYGTGSVDWTPTVTGLTEGNGTWTDSYYRQIGDMVFVGGTFILGSTSALTGFTIALPVTAADAYGPNGVAYLYDFSAGFTYVGLTKYTASAASAEVHATEVSGSYLLRSSLGASAPFTWAVSDRVTFAFSYRV